MIPAEGSSAASLKMSIEHDLEISSLGIYPIGILLYMKHDMYIASWFVVAKDWKSVSDMLNNVWYVHTVGRYTIVEI